MSSPGFRLLRAVVALGVVLAALRLFLPPSPLEGGTFPTLLLAWFGFAFGIGLVLARWWALLLALLPVAGFWYTRATGPEYLGYGDEVALLTWATILGPGLAGTALGVSAHRALTGFVARRLMLPARAVERLVVLAVLVALLAGAAVDWGRGGAYLRRVEPVQVRRYSEEAVSGDTAGLAFAVDGASPGEGEQAGALRHTLSPPGLPPTETYTLIYCDARCRRSSDVQIMSAPPEYGRAARQTDGTPDKPVPPPTEPVEVGGVTWQLLGGRAAAPVEADADLGDAYVRIRAPNRAHFERVAASLRRINR